MCQVCGLHIFPQNVALTWVFKRGTTLWTKRDTMTGPQRNKLREKIISICLYSTTVYTKKVALCHLSFVITILVDFVVLFLARNLVYSMTLLSYFDMGRMA